jgi:hypothetical protein
MGKKKKFKCERCGKTFETKRALAIHTTKKHSSEGVFPTYTGENVEVRTEDGNHVEIVLKIKKSLWKDIVKTAKEEKLSIEQAVINALVNFTAVGLHKTFKKMVEEEKTEYFT